MDWAPLAGAAATVLVAIIGGFFAFFGGRVKTRIDFQQAINSGFTTLLAEHRKDTDQLRDVIRELRQTCEAQADVIEAVEQDRRRVTAHALALEGQLKRAGLTPLQPSDVNEI